MVGIEDKDIIQKAAAVQALVTKFLSNQNRTVIDFSQLNSPGYWYQQEVLKLVMRVYNEGQTDVTSGLPSVLYDAKNCLDHLERKKNGTTSPTKPSEKYYKAFQDLTKWRKEEVDDGLYAFKGPVLKPLQSLFNKLFIRRGQTGVHIIGDYVRASLMADNKDALQKIVTKITDTFPNIAEDDCFC